MKKSILMMTCFGVIFVSGCTTLRKPLTVESRNSIHSNQIIAETDQHAINSTVNLTRFNGATLAPLGFVGIFVGSMIELGIDQHRAKIAYQDIYPIHNVLLNYHFSHKFVKHLDAELEAVKWLKVKRARFVYDLPNKQLRKYIQSSPENTALYLFFSYNMSADFRILRVYLHADLYQIEPRTYPGYKKLYYNTFIFQDQLPVRYRSYQPAIAAWTAHHGQRLRMGLNQAIHSLNKALLSDIANPNQNPYQNLPNSLSIKFYNELNQQTPGKIIAQQNGYYMVRSKNENIYIFNKNNMQS